MIEDVKCVDGGSPFSVPGEHPPEPRSLHTLSLRDAGVEGVEDGRLPMSETRGLVGLGGSSVPGEILRPNLIPPAAKTVGYYGRCRKGRWSEKAKERSTKT